jgi:hypothetical protein
MVVGVVKVVPDMLRGAPPVKFERLVMAILTI